MKNNFKRKFSQKSHLIFLAMFILALIYIHQLIYLGGDDFIYGSYVKGSVTDFFNKHIYHYMFKNGRAIVHFVVTLFLLFDVYLWRIINPLIIGYLIVVMCKLTTSDKDKYKKVILLLIMLFSFISINISREAIYWLDGSFNYLYPMLLCLLNIYLVKRSIQNNVSYWYLPILGFFTGATVEQCGLMTIGVLALILIDKLFINRKKLFISIYINFFTTIIGYLTVVLAPGNFIRSSNQKAEILGNIIHLLRYNFMSDKMEIFLLILSLSAILWLICFIKRGYNKKLNFSLLILMILNFVIYLIIGFFTNNIAKLINKFINENIQLYSSLWEATSILDSSNIFGSILWGIAALSGIFTVSVIVYEAVIIYIKDKEVTMLSFTIVAIGAQIMMIISPVYGYRTVFPSLIAWFLVITYSIINNFNNKYMLMMILICVIFSVNNKYFIIWGIIFIVLYNLVQNIKIKNIINYLFAIMIGATVVFNVYNTIVGFTENKSVHKYNLNAIEEYKNNGCDGELILKKANNFEYRYTMIYESEPHVSSFKKYYGLPDKTTIIFE